MRRKQNDGPTSAAELVAELQQDPAFIARQAQQERDRAQHAHRYALAAAGLLRELAAHGFAVEHVRQLPQLGRP